MQLPGLRLWRRNDPCLTAGPKLMQFIHFFAAVKIEPNQHRPGISIPLAKSRIGQEDSAEPPRNACDPAVLATPVQSKTEIVHVVGCSFGDVIYRYFWDRT